jgi:hypothetical protein
MRTRHHTRRCTPRYRDVIAHLKSIEVRYGVDLNTSGKDGIFVVKGSWY